MGPILFDDLDAEAKKRALAEYKEIVYPELGEGHSAEELVELIGPFTDDDSLVREIRTLGIVFTKDGSPATDGELLFISYQDAEGVTLVHLDANDIRSFKPHYLRYTARKLDRAIL